MNMPQNNNLQQARVENTRNTILDAAVALYQSQGIDGTSISSVIEKSGAGRTTFYRHFNDRGDLLNQALKRDFDALMLDFNKTSKPYRSLELQIEEDIVWFLSQFEHRPALSLLFSDIEWQNYEHANNSMSAFREAAITCTLPIYERALAEGRLREGITIDQYIDWAAFVVVSLQTVNLPASQNSMQSREMLRKFLVPSLIRIDPR